PKSLGLRTGYREMASRTWSMCCCNKVDGLVGVYSFGRDGKISRLSATLKTAGVVAMTSAGSDCIMQLRSNDNPATAHIPYPVRRQPKTMPGAAPDRRGARPFP